MSERRIKTDATLIEWFIQRITLSDPSAPSWNIPLNDVFRTPYDLGNPIRASSLLNFGFVGTQSCLADSNY